MEQAPGRETGMPKFRATVRLPDLDGADPAAVQHSVEGKLKQAGFERWRILKIEAQGKPPRRPRELPPLAARAGAPAQSTGAGGILLIGAGALAIWFFVYSITGF